MRSQATQQNRSGVIPLHADASSARALAQDAAPGPFLRAAREAAGRSVDDISAALKIRAEHLEALESEDWDALPATPYAVAFARAYASALDLDAGAIARQFKERIEAARTPDEPEEAAREPGAEDATAPVKLASLAVIGAIALFALWIALRMAAGGGEADAQNDAAASPAIRVNAPDPDARPQLGALIVEPDAAPGRASSPSPSSTPSSPSTPPRSKIANLAPSDAPPLMSPPISTEISPEIAPPISPSLSSRRSAPLPDGAVIVGPTLERRVAPRYPSECAQRAGGSVSVLFDVTAAGGVANARIAQSADDCFNAAALAAIKAWRFAPRTIDGAARPARDLRARLEFSGG